MKIYYSANTKGFYNSDVHGTNIPTDAIEITAAQYDSLLTGVNSGQVISVVNNVPTLVAAPPLTAKELVPIISGFIQSKLDAGAQAWNYDSIVSAASYANSTNTQYAADAKALVGWRDAVWQWAIPQFATLAAGTDPNTFVTGMPAQPVKPVA